MSSKFMHGKSKRVGVHEVIERDIVSGAEALLEATQKCWASLWTARAIGYRARQGIPPERVDLAVVVRLLVDAEAAGRIFTANPVSGQRDQAVVGGAVNPDTLTVDKRSKAKLLGIDPEKFLPGRGGGRAEDRLKGVACSPGRVTAVARVLHGPEEFDQMRPGDILVAGITTPAWTPLFALASGIVTDVGGPLSHGSIVAREYGIPAVRGTGEATRRIQSGQTVTVDGGEGVVYLKT
jgi:phosphoenolpyruvate synthase/pyruvate phosphate dikinase